MTKPGDEVIGIPQAGPVQNSFFDLLILENDLDYIKAHGVEKFLSDPEGPNEELNEALEKGLSKESIQEIKIGGDLEDFLTLEEYPEELINALPNLKKIEIYSGMSFNKLPKLPDGIEHFEVNDNITDPSGSKITEIEGPWPASLKSVTLDNLHNLEKLPDWSRNENLTTVEIHIDSTSVQHNIDNRTYSKLSLPNLPAGLKHLKLNHVTKPNGIIFPPTLESLYINNCKLPVAFTQPLPESLKELTIYNQDELTFDQNLPNLQVLKLIDFGPLEEITPTSLSSGSLRKIDLTGCDALLPTSPLTARLQEIEAAHENNSVTYPERYYNDQLKWKAKLLTDLNTGLERYGINKRESALKKMFNGYTSKSLGSRDLKEIEKNAKFIIELINENFSHIEWMEELAKAYTMNACVNQPVAGWFELCAYTSIARQTSMINKVEASRQVLFLEVLTNHISEQKSQIDTAITANYHNSLGQEFEVEFLNALIKSLHEILQKEGLIERDWPGLESKIVHLEAISHLMKDFAPGALSLIKEKVFSWTQEELADKMLGSARSDAWMMAIAHGTNMLQDAKDEVTRESKRLHELAEQKMGQYYEKEEELLKVTNPPKDNSTIKDEITRIFTEIQRIEAQIEANESFVIREILAKHIGDELATQREVNLYRLDIDRYLEKASGGIAVDESPWQLSSESDDDRAAEAAPSSFEATQCLFSAIGAVTGSTVIKIENERKRSVSPDPAVQDPEITHQDKKLHL